MYVFLMCFFSNLYLYNTALSVLFCVNKDIIFIFIIKRMVEQSMHFFP